MTWCILRMSAARTLAVVASLKESGFEVWTPTASERRKKPRSNKFRDGETALLSTFAFAKAEHVERLLQIEHAPVSAHPAFTVFRRDESVPTIRDRDLRPLRDFEAKVRHEWEAFLKNEAEEAKRKRKKSRARAYVLGQRVRMMQPAFAGLVGEIVEIRNNGDLAIEFTGFVRGAVVPSCDVIPVQLSGGLSEQDEAA